MEPLIHWTHFNINSYIVFFVGYKRELVSEFICKYWTTNIHNNNTILCKLIHV